MATIVDVTKKFVYVKDGAVYYEISKELFPFRPKVGYQIKIFKDENDNLVDIILLSTYNYQEKKKQSKRILNLQSIYSILVGMMLSIVVIQENNAENPFSYFVYWIAITLIVTSIVTLLTRHLRRMFVGAIITTSIYALFIILGLAVVFVKNNSLGFIVALIGFTPTLLNSFYFHFRQKEKTPKQRHFPY